MELLRMANPMGTERMSVQARRGPMINPKAPPTAPGTPTIAPPPGSCPVVRRVRAATTQIAVSAPAKAPAKASPTVTITTRGPLRKLPE
jgi:hypothetical protein